MSHTLTPSTGKKSLSHGDMITDLRSIWDLFRSQMPFLTVLDPATVAQQIRSLIDTYEHEGWLPDCRMSLNKGYTQGMYARYMQGICFDSQ